MAIFLMCLKSWASYRKCTKNFSRFRLFKKFPFFTDLIHNLNWQNNFDRLRLLRVTLKNGLLLMPCTFMGKVYQGCWKCSDYYYPYFFVFIFYQKSEIGSIIHLILSFISSFILILSFLRQIELFSLKKWYSETSE